MVSFRLPVTHRPDRDGRPVHDRHVPFYLALEVTAQAWARALASTCDGLLDPRELAVVHVAGDHRRELFVGDVVFDVVLQKVGVSSLTFAIELTQYARAAASVTTTLVRVDADREHSIPFSADQRAGLELLLRG